MPLVKKFGLSSHQEDAAVLNNGIGGCELSKFEVAGQQGQSFRKGDIVKLTYDKEMGRVAALMSTDSNFTMITAGYIVIETFTDTADEGIAAGDTSYMIVAKIYDQGVYEINLENPMASLEAGFCLSSGRISTAAVGDIIISSTTDVMRRPVEGTETPTMYQSAVVHVSISTGSIPAAISASTRSEQEEQQNEQ